MTPEEQCIAIAEACGYRKGENKPLWWACPIGQPFKACGVEDLPDYLNDLNAMHEAEKVLNPEQRAEFIRCIWDQVAPSCTNYINHACYFIAHATAAQRAEAFLRTLNLWKDDE
jgi:hypothetical protein